jgi:aryl-alcohol dehydrogenase-like predicted oxidoreductase
VRYALLDGTSIEVSVVCLGTMAMCPHKTYGEPDDEESVAAIRAALDAGINFFDTAEAYGDGYAEEILGRALEGRRDEAVIATKVSRRHLREEDLRRSCEDSLRRLRTDRIDLYQVHWPNHEIPFEETAGLLDALREEGKVRAWGVSNFGKLDLPGALEAGRPVSNQVPYSLLWRAVEHDIVPVCVERDVSIICYSPLAQGILTGKFGGPEEIPPARRRPRYCDEGVIDLAFDVVAEVRAVSQEIGEPMADVALAWLLARPGVTSVIAGASSGEQVVENARAGNLELPAGILERLTRASRPLRDALDANPDMWQAGEDSRYR